MLVAFHWQPAHLFLIAAVPTLVASLTAYVLMTMLRKSDARPASSLGDAKALA